LTQESKIYADPCGNGSITLRFGILQKKMFVDVEEKEK
jgi:hypothetical protein